MSDLSPIPLPKKLYDEAKELGISSIELEFRGGNDEGNLYVVLVAPKTDDLVKIVKRKQRVSKLETDVETWAFDAYQYSGAGDGNDYGDDVTYNLETMKASVSSWMMERVDLDPDPEVSIEIETENENENEEEEDDE
jgi:hypothetical protein